MQVIDDHSRFLVASAARAIFKAADVVASFHEAASTHGFPASLLTDNGAVFTAIPAQGRTLAIELETAALGIRYLHSSPYHPQTCGKVERIHQTLKRWLAKHPPAATVEALQTELDRFRTYYNDERPHRAVDRRTPAEAFTAASEGEPVLPPVPVEAHVRVRRDKIDITGVDHASSQLTASSHRPRSPAGGDARAGAGGRAPYPGDHRGRGADP